MDKNIRGKLHNHHENLKKSASKIIFVGQQGFL